jgi:hypothetical protein
MFEEKVRCAIVIYAARIHSDDRILNTSLGRWPNTPPSAGTSARRADSHAPATRADLFYKFLGRAAHQTKRFERAECILFRLKHISTTVPTVSAAAANAMPMNTTNRDVPFM